MGASMSVSGQGIPLRRYWSLRHKCHQMRKPFSQGGSIPDSVEDASRRFKAVSQYEHQSLGGSHQVIGIGDEVSWSTTSAVTMR